MLEFPKKRGESAKICVFGILCHILYYSSVPLSAPRSKQRKDRDSTVFLVPACGWGSEFGSDLCNYIIIRFEGTRQGTQEALGPGLLVMFLYMREDSITVDDARYNAQRRPYAACHSERSSFVHANQVCLAVESCRFESPQILVGLRTPMQNAAFFERKGPERKPWPRGKPLNRKK